MCCRGVGGAKLRSGGVGALCHRLSGVVASGQALLIVGPSGCGKSSILRAIAGLWRLGSGVVRIGAARDRCAFLPQQPYLPLGDTLRDQMLFPKTQEGVGSGGVAFSPGRGLAGSAELEQSLESVGLGHVLERVGGLDVARDWGAELSPGEQQRLAMARLLTGQVSTHYIPRQPEALDWGPASDRLFVIIAEPRVPRRGDLGAGPRPGGVGLQGTAEQREQRGRRSSGRRRHDGGVRGAPPVAASVPHARSELREHCGQRSEGGRGGRGAVGMGDSGELQSAHRPLSSTKDGWERPNHNTKVFLKTPRLRENVCLK